MDSHRRWVSLLVTGLGVAALWYLARSSAWTLIGAGFQRLEPQSAAIGAGLYLVFVGCKAVRYRLLLGPVPGLPLLRAVGLHTFWSNLLPARTGDVAYVLLLRRDARVPATEGASALILASIADVWWMALSTVGVGLLFWFQGVQESRVLVAVLGGVGAIGAGMIGLFASRPVARRLDRWAAGRLDRWPTLAGRLRNLFRFFLGRATAPRLIVLFLLSGLLLGLRYGLQVYLMSAMYPTVPARATLFALVFSSWVNFLPIQGIGNVGSVELPWAWAMHQVAVPAQTALASGFALHGVVFGYALAVGALAALLPRRS